jgi:hypothetical protein
MIRQLLRLGLPVAGLELALVGGAAFFTWEHDQGKHEQPQKLCPICLLNWLAPPPAQTEAAAQE